jgi:hypothetical protein
MKGFGFFRNVNGSCAVHSFDRRGELSSIDEVTALMMERPDVDIKVVKLPQIREDEVQTMLKYKLRSLYPGNPEETVFDYKVVADKNQKYAVLFIMNKEVLDAYRRKAEGKPLFLPYSLVNPFLKNYQMTNPAFLFVHVNWIEILFFDKGVIAASAVVQREGNLQLTLRKAVNLFPEDNGNFTFIAVCSRSEHGDVEKAIAKIFNNEVAFDYLFLETVLSTTTNRIDYLFYPKRRKAAFLHSKWSFALLFVVSFFLLGLAINKKIVNYRSHFSMLSEQINILQSARLKTISLKEEVEKLELRWARLNEKTPNNTYQILSELSTIFDGDMQISHIVIDRGALQIEAVGQNPLYLMEKFKSNGHFQDVKLTQSVPINGTFKERFRVIGIAKTD